MAYIGYNVKKANELMQNIANAYKDLGIYTPQQWEDVYKTLQREWVGEDEQDFETELADRICKLYNNAYNLVQGSLDTIKGLVKSWYEFQQKNTLSGNQSTGNKGGIFGIGGNGFGLEDISIVPNEKIVSPHLVQLTPESNRGLQSADSKSKIQTSIDAFVKEIKKQTENLFEEIQTNQAFFGEQTNTIKNYIVKVGEAVGEVTVAVKDMYNALDQLVGSNYSSTIENINEGFSKASGNVDTSLNDLGSSRWN